MATLQEKPRSATIVIPTFHRPGLAVRLATQIRKFHGASYEIIIVDQDNANPPPAKDLKKLKTEYINLPGANTSIAKNTGIGHASGEIVVFFDDDIEITGHTIPAHLREYDDSSVAGVSGRVIIDGEAVPKHTDVETGKTNFLGTKFLYQFWSTKRQAIDFPYGCNMSFTKAIILKCKGFDPRFPKIFEEVDLGVRVSKSYGTILFAPEALAYHHKAKSGGIRPEEHANKQRLIFQHYGKYLGKNIRFTFSLVSLIMRLKTAIFQAPSAISDLLFGYVRTLFACNWLMILLFGIILFLRFWKVPDFFIFTFSEEWQGTLAWELVKHFHRIWIGVSQANIHYYLGPGFIYLNYLLFLLDKGKLEVLAYFSAFLGILTLLTLYYVTDDLFDRSTALCATILYGCSTLLNYYDRRFWNPSFIPLFSILFVYSLVKADKNSTWYILTAFLIGASFHFHLLLLLFVIPAIYSVIKNFRNIGWKIRSVSVLIYLVLTSPLIVFDLVHNFDNFLVPFRILFTKGSNELYAVSLSNMRSHIHIFLSALGRLWFVALGTNLQEIVLETNTYKIPGNILLILFSLIALFWFFFKNRKPGYRIFFISLVAIVAAFIVYPSYNPEYYLVGFLTLMTIVIGFWLKSLPKPVRVFILTVFVAANILTVLSTTNDYGLVMRERVVKKTMAIVKNRSFGLTTAGPLPNPQYAYAGWRLIFKIYGKTPSRSSVDSVLGWIYPDEISARKPAIHVTVSEAAITFKTQPLASIKEGVYYSYITGNEIKK